MPRRVKLEDIPNCWEVEDCEPALRKTCPAYPDMGRECWKVSGTKCAGGKFENRLLTIKIMHCRNKCDYYKRYLKQFNR